jgi:hypothetical protein
MVVFNDLKDLIAEQSIAAGVGAEVPVFKAI